MVRRTWLSKCSNRPKVTKRQTSSWKTLISVGKWLKTDFFSEQINGIYSKRQTTLSHALWLDWFWLSTNFDSTNVLIRILNAIFGLINYTTTEYHTLHNHLITWHQNDMSFLFWLMIFYLWICDFIHTILFGFHRSNW